MGRIFRAALVMALATISLTMGATNAQAITDNHVAPTPFGTAAGSGWQAAYVVSPNLKESVWKWSTVANAWGLMKVEPGEFLWVYPTSDTTSTWAFSVSSDGTRYGWYWVRRSLLARWTCNAPANVNLVLNANARGFGRPTDADYTSPVDLASGTKVKRLCAGQFAEANQAMVAPTYRNGFVYVQLANGAKKYIHPERLSQA